MPLHDWRPVSDNIFHAFHLGWIWNLAGVLNREVLPPGYVARPEESLGLYGSDVLVLDAGSAPPATEATAGISTAAGRQPTLTLAPVQFVLPRSRRIAVFSTREERRVAVIEVVSRGNRDSSQRAAALRDKLLAYLESGLQLAVIDLWPGPGFAGAVARALGDQRPVPDGDRYLASFECSVEPPELRIYVEPLAVGRPLPNLTLFLGPSQAHLVPLESSYSQTVEGLPEIDRRRLR